MILIKIKDKITDSLIVNKYYHIAVNMDHSQMFNYTVNNFGHLEKRRKCCMFRIM